MSYDFREAFNVFSRMSSRERVLVGLAAFALFVISMWSFVVDPLTTGRTELASRVRTKERELHTVVHLRQTYLDIQQKLQAGQHLLSKVDPNFPLLTHLESTISQVVPRERINSMNPSSKPIGNEYVEQLVEIKMTQISLEQLVQMLYRIEKSDQPLRVTRLQVKKRPHDIRNFDVTATVSLVRAAT